MCFLKVTIIQIFLGFNSTKGEMMQILNYETKGLGIGTTPCPYKTNIVVGSSVGCGNCDYFVCKADKKVTCSHPSLSKIDVLKRMLDGMLFEGDEHAILGQAIDALDNPLGVLPGDEIEVWDERTKCFVKTFKGYSSALKYHWETDSGYWQHARIPVIKEDVTFHNVDVELLEEHRLALLNLAEYCRETNVLNRFIDTLDGIQHMLDEWSDKRFHEKEEKS